jgi:hypothetical protein
MMNITVASVVAPSPSAVERPLAWRARCALLVATSHAGTPTPS